MNITLPEEDLSKYCAPGVAAHTFFVETSPGVSLRVFSFTPAAPSNKPAIAFVAGWISMISGWKEVLREMTRDLCVYYIETREKSSSQIRGRAAFGVKEIGGDLVPLIRRLGLSRYVLVGSSLGATAVVDCFPLLDPKPAAIVLIAPNAVFRVPRLWKFIVTIFYAPSYALIRPAVKWYLRNFRLNVAADRAQYDKYSTTLDAADPKKLKKAVMAVWSYEIWKKLSSVDCPVLVVNASLDSLHEPDTMKRIIAGLPRAVEVDLQTNARTHDRPVVDVLRKFLATLPQ